MSDKKEKFDLNIHTARLLQSEPFFAAFSRRINKMASDVVPTAGVRVNPTTQKFELFYNPEYFNTLTDSQRTDVLKHEFYHLIFEHVTSRKPEDVGNRIWNFATDLAINSHLNNLPEMCLKPGVGLFEEFPSGLSSEAYLKLLQKMQEEDDSALSDASQFDSHDEWGDQAAGGDSEQQQQANDIARERLRDYLKKAADEASKSSSGWGDVPADVRKDILSKLKTEINWRKVLRYFVKTSTRSSKSLTVKRLNKRYRYIHAGKKVTRMARIAVSIDQSGSVTDAMLSAFFSELNNLAKLATFTVIPFDTRVDESLVYEWKKGQSHKTERVMQGGTCFDAPTDYVNKKGFDGHIILTDLMAPKPKASKCQRMWMTTKRYAQKPWFATNERVIAIDV